tara:strand:- start:286 stop:609 length:324 start_codon:yes stop_codon:yes gene_type:complete
MKVLKFLAVIIGVLITASGLHSCKKDEPNEPVLTKECCEINITYSEDDGGETIYAKICDDGYTYSKYTYSNGETYTYTYNWLEEDSTNTWDYQKSIAYEYGGTCKFE